MEQDLKKTQTNDSSWKNLFIVTFLSGFIYVFMEWLFLVTKPSFMDMLGILQKVRILAFAQSFIVLVCFFVLFFIFSASRIPWLRRWQDLLFRMSAILPAGILASAALLLLDNFTYTVFKFGIVSTHGVFRGVYAAILLGLVAYFSGYVLKIISQMGASNIFRRHSSNLSYIIAGILVVSLSLPLANGYQSFSLVPSGDNTAEKGKRPHIFLLTIDGLNADHLSLYGYERHTTPFLEELANTSLVADNAFNNSGNTSGSVTSMLTSKLPSETRVLYPPNILRGSNAYQHLPGILRLNGYRTIQITSPYYIDSYDLNMQESFDIANGRVYATESDILAFFMKYLPVDYARYFSEIGYRLADRLRHIFYIEEMVNPYDLIMEPANDMINDDIRLKELMQAVEETDQPLFVHVHFMTTHGPEFVLKEPHYSLGKENPEQWDTDYYDDSIVEVDQTLEEFVGFLEQKGLFEHSILIIGTDHGKKYTIHDRLPLLFRFPQGEFAGRISASVQGIDIAPTILDYLDIPIPSWMKGASLIAGEPGQRPIWAFTPIAIIRGEQQYFKLDMELAKPPFYQIRTISLAHCQNWYWFDLWSHGFGSGELSGYVKPCPSEELLSQEDALRMMIDHMKEAGYDVRSLEGLSLNK